MKNAEKFGRLLVRFWPFWLPLLLIFLVPWTRPFGRLASDDFVDFAVETFTNHRPNAAMPVSAAHPADFDLLIWQRWNSLRNNPNYYSYNTTGANHYDELVKLRRRFPAEPLLVAPPLQHQFGLPSSEELYYDYNSPQTNPVAIAKELKLLRTSAQNGIQLEPDNAFWWVSLAETQWRLKRYDLALGALERAAKCSRYDDYTIELARHLVRAQQRYGAPTFFDKLEILEAVGASDGSKMNVAVQLWAAHARRLRNKGDSARSLRWAGALLVVGALMQRDNNSWPTAKMGRIWQSVAYKIVPPARKGKVIASNHSIDFAAFARANGRADLAQLAPRSQRVQALAGKPGQRYGEMLWLRRGQLDQWVSLLAILPLILASNLIYLALWWLSANLFLWRARAAPSSRRERVGLAVKVMLPLALLGALGLRILDAYDGVQMSLLQAVAGSSMTFAFCGAPFVLALCCALIALRRHRAHFALPPRLNTELALAAPTRLFLRWFLPACVMLSIALLLLAWAAWLTATARKWGSVDLLALLPPDRRGFTNSLLWDSTGPTLPSYAVFLCVLCLFIWFGRWRWTTPVTVRPLTQGALRSWKETLGAAIVVLVWISLLLAFASVPLLREADARLERVLNVGDLTARN